MLEKLVGGSCSWLTKKRQEVSGRNENRDGQHEVRQKPQPRRFVCVPGIGQKCNGTDGCPHQGKADYPPGETSSAKKVLLGTVILLTEVDSHREQADKIADQDDGVRNGQVTQFGSPADGLLMLIPGRRQTHPGLGINPRWKGMLVRFLCCDPLDLFRKEKLHRQVSV